MKAVNPYYGKALTTAVTDCSMHEPTTVMTRETKMFGFEASQGTVEIAYVLRFLPRQHS